MKKVSIILIVVSLILGIVAISGISQTIIPMNVKQSDVAIKNYNHNPDNLLDNIFIEDSEMIIPIILNNYREQAATPLITMEKLRDEFQRKNMTVNSIENNKSAKGIGNGAEITTFENDNLYTMLIYGDVNGDGMVNLNDARRIVNYVVNPANYPITGISFKAADIANKDTSAGVVNLNDARRIVNFVISNNALLQVEPTALAEIDTIESISLLHGPTKNEYNYGTTAIDVRGAQIQLNWESGKVTTTGITDSMITTSDDLNTPGIKTFTVTYEGFTTTFTVKVLNKFDEIEITGSVKDGVYDVINGYKGYVNEIFHLGVLQSVDRGDTSKLEIGQLSPSNIKTELVSSTDSEATNNTIKVTPHVDENGNIVLYVEATKIGIYRVIISVNEDGTNIELPINFEIAQNEKIDRIELEPITSDKLEVKAGYDNVLIAEIKVFNEKNEEINPADITISNVPDGVTVRKTDSKTLEISTTITEPKGIEFTINAISKNSAFGTKSENISIAIKEEPYVADISINSNEITLYTEEQPGVTTKLPNDERIYTVLPIEFKDQDGNKINVSYNQIQAVLNASDVQKGKMGVITPMVKYSINGTTQSLPRSGVEIKYFTDNALNEALGDNPITKIGISVSVYSSIVKVNLAELSTKNITFATYTKTVDIPLHVIYTETVTMKIVEDTNLQKNLQAKQDNTHDYVVYVGDKFVLGKVTTDGNAVDIELDKFGVKETVDGLTIGYEKDSNGNILITGTATKTGMFRITPIIKDGVAESSNSRIIKVIDKPEELNVEIIDTGVDPDYPDIEFGYTKDGEDSWYIGKIAYKNSAGNEKEVQFKDIEFTYTSEGSGTVTLCKIDDNGDLMDLEITSTSDLHETQHYLYIDGGSEGEQYTLRFNINGQTITKTITL